MATLKDVQNMQVRELGSAYSINNFVLGGLSGAVATFTNTQSPASGFRTVIKGIPAAVADFGVTALATVSELQIPETGRDGYYTQPAGTTVYYLCVLNAAGTPYFIQGSYVGQAPTPYKAKLGDGLIPNVAVADKYAPVGIFKLVNATNPFIIGTTLWNAAGVTVTKVASLNRLWSLDPADYTFA